LAKHSEVDLSFRLGAALLATAAGAALGLLLGLLFLLVGWSQSLGRPAAGGAIAGALSGALLPVGAMDFVEGTVHFFIGLFVTGVAVAAEDVPSGFFPGGAERPPWLRWAFIFGVVFAVILWVASHL
jgi:hypothetical protein